MISTDCPHPEEPRSGVSKDEGARYCDTLTLGVSVYWQVSIKAPDCPSAEGSPVAAGGLAAGSLFAITAGAGGEGFPNDLEIVGKPALARLLRA